MYQFKNDYSEGAHPKILEALIKNNLTQEAGYGEDRHTQNAINAIKKLIEDDVDVHLISAGTQTNLIMIGSILRPHEACIAAETGHIAVHEAGAIEHTGHKVLTIESKDGKLTPEKILPVMATHTDEHMVKPKMVYISNPTEIGTIYSLDELKKLSTFCKENDLYLYADGARLGTALVNKEASITLSDMAKYTDAFFIGGTKNGALLGEALVIKTNELKRDFRYLIKQKGALLAKGRIMGIQFEELFKDQLFFDLAIHANTEAKRLQDGIKALGYDFLIKSPTNQIFPIFPNAVITELEKEFAFYVWCKVSDTHSAIRLVTSWATNPTEVNRFLRVLEGLK